MSNAICCKLVIRLVLLDRGLQINPQSWADANLIMAIQKVKWHYTPEQ